jgi:transposase
VKEGKEMGEAYSEDLRQRILRAVDKGLAVRQVAGLFEVSTSFIYKALIRRRTTGETGARARGGRVAKKRVGHHEALLERVRLEPDITLSELQEWLLKTFGVSSSIGGLWNTFNKLGLSFKKNVLCRRTDAA